MASEVYLKWTGKTHLSNSESRVEEYVTDVNEYITITKKAIETLKERISSLETTKSELEEQLAIQTNKNDTLNTTINTLNEDIRSLNTEITRLETEISRLDKENVDLKGRIEILEGSLEDQEVANEKIQGLTEELTTANTDATQHEQNINSIIANSAELDDSIFPFVFDARDFVITPNTSSKVKEQTENKLVVRPATTVSSYIDCGFKANYDGLRVGKKYKLSLRSGSTGNALVVKNGTQSFVPDYNTGLLEKEFIAEVENLELAFSIRVLSNDQNTYGVYDISLIECE